MDQLKLLAIISTLIFLVMIPISIINGVYAFIPDLFIFIALTWFYYWTYNAFKMNMPIFTMLIIGHISHAVGIFGWYHISPIPIQWDHVTHFFGAFPFALLFFRWMEQWMDAQIITKKNIMFLITIFLAASGVGAMVELSEFLGYLKFGFGDGLFRFGPGDGLEGKTGSDLIESLGGGWINEGWDFIFNTTGIVFGMALMLFIRATRKKAKQAYYFEQVEKYSKLTR